MDVHVNVPSCLFSVVVNVRDMTVDRDTVSNFFKEDSSSAEILREESENVKNDDLKVLYRGHTVPLPLLLLLRSCSWHTLNVLYLNSFGEGSSALF